MNGASEPTEVVSVGSDPMLTRLRRAEGQLSGVIKMYADERSCVDIVRQLLAVRNALGSAARALLTTEAGRCSRERRITDLDAVIKELLKG